MELMEAMNKRRSYRALENVEIEDEDVKELLKAASLAPSCFNNQSWRYVMVKDPEQLEKVFETLTRGNYWAKRASLMVVVFTKDDLDCDTGGIRYAQFDTGMATGFMLLKATEMDLIAHPMAGFDNDEVAEVLGIPEDHKIITLIAVGKKSEDLSILGEKHQEQEKSTRDRKPIEEIGFMDGYPK